MKKIQQDYSRRSFVRQAGLATAGLLTNFAIKGNATSSFKPEFKRALDCTDNLPYNLSINLVTTKNYPNYLVLDGSNAVSYAKSPYTEPTKEFLDVSWNLEEGCDPGNTCSSDHSLLKYYVYYPDPSVYTTLYTCSQLPPAIIYTHPGGFQDCNDIDDDTHGDIMCREFVQRGFVVFRIEYRRGRVNADTGEIYNNEFTPYTTAQQALCYYRAFQDIRGAIKSIIQRNIDGQAYKFDGNNIFLAGASAGAILSINAAYYPTYPGTSNPQDMIDVIDAGAHSYLGPVDQDYYYGATTIEYQSKIKAVLNLWGNGFIPVDKKSQPGNYFPTESKIPAISFHGYGDQVVYFKERPVFFPDPNTTSQPDTQHNNTSVIINPVTRCLPDLPQSFELPYNTEDYPVPQLWRFGSKELFCYLNSNSVYTELYVDSSMGHGADDITDNFGLTGISTVDEIYVYIAERTLCFFQAILNRSNTTFFSALKNSSNNKLFVDCVNTRTASSTSNTSCTNPDPPGITCS